MLDKSGLEGLERVCSYVVVVGVIAVSLTIVMCHNFSIAEDPGVSLPSTEG